MLELLSCLGIVAVLSLSLSMSLSPSLSLSLSCPKTGLGRRVSQKKLASEAYRALGGVARNSIANRTIVGH